MKRRLVAAVVASLCLFGVLSACAGVPMTDPTTPASPGPAATPGSLTPAPPPADAGGSPADVAADRWTAIGEDLARRGVSGTSTLVSVEDVTWPDGSLGCPSPGQSYTQATVDGQRVVVSVDGKEYDYRFGRTDVPKLCDQLLPGGLRTGPNENRAL